jgi:hypothetical protein
MMMMMMMMMMMKKKKKERSGRNLQYQNWLKQVRTIIQRYKSDIMF